MGVWWLLKGFARFFFHGIVGSLWSVGAWEAGPRIEAEGSRIDGWAREVFG